MRRFNLIVLISTVIMAMAAWAGETPLVASPAVPAAAGNVNYDMDRNGNVKLKISTKHLAPPDRLTPPKSTYVVWITPPGGQPQNAGALAVNDKLEGSLTTTTPAKAFDVRVTAEDNPAVPQPTGPEVLHASVQVR
jgi:hypothetical protein